MKDNKSIIGFIGSGAIARSHSFALDTLQYYYNDAPAIEKEAVCSATKESRDSFASKYGFRYSLSIEDFFKNGRIDTVYILGPNKVHYEHLKGSLKMPGIKRVYIEKPLCSTPGEEISIKNLAEEHKDVKIQMGFQFLFVPAIREAISFWKSGILGNPLHFEFKYYHGDYLNREYREKRQTRLAPAPEGGAMADLGSHAISLLIAFIGDKIKIVNTLQGGGFEDVPVDSDLFSVITFFDPCTKAVGTISSSRISSGTGDTLSFEIYAERGAIKYTSASPDYYEYFSEDSGIWHKIFAGSNYKPLTSFPSGHVPPGWLRSLIHAHYVFFTSNDTRAFIPDLAHGLAVQKILRESAVNLKIFRDTIYQ